MSLWLITRLGDNPQALPQCRVLGPGLRSRRFQVARGQILRPEFSLNPGLLAALRAVLAARIGQIEPRSVPECAPSPRHAARGEPTSRSAILQTLARILKCGT